MRVSIAAAAAIVLGLDALPSLGVLFGSRESGPPPEGEPIARGVVMGYDAADGADVVVAEIRGRRSFPGQVREQLWLLRAPFGEGDGEPLGRGATLGRISRDGRLVSWLASKERGRSTGPGRVRLAERGARTVELRAMLPPAIAAAGGAGALALIGYNGTSGRGTLSRIDLAAGTHGAAAPNVPPGAFAVMRGGGVFVVRRPFRAGAGAEAAVLAGGASTTITRALDWDGPPPAFRIAPDRGSVVLRLEPAPDGRRALVRWREGEGGVTAIAKDVAAWTVDAEGRAWWATAGAGTLRIFREDAPGGEPVGIGEVAGTDPASLHPLPGGRGAWVALADRPCRAGHAGERGCVRLAAAGDAPPPPEVRDLRRVESAPSGWPIALLGPPRGHPALVAVADPATPLVVESGGALGIAFAEDGRHAAARLAEGGGRERILLLDLAGGSVRVLGEHAPESEISWHGDALLYAWRHRQWRGDPRNGLYRVRVGPGQGSAAAADGD